MHYFTIWKYFLPVFICGSQGQHDWLLLAVSKRTVFISLRFERLSAILQKGMYPIKWKVRTAFTLPLLWQFPTVPCSGHGTSTWKKNHITHHWYPEELKMFPVQQHPKQRSPRCAQGLWFCVSLCIPVVKWGWIYKLDLLCSLLHFGSPQAEANPSSQAAAQGCWLSFALPWKCPKFWLQRFPVVFSPCQEGSGSLTGTSRDFPWGKSFPLGLLCPEPWLLPLAPGWGQKGRRNERFYWIRN